MKLDERAEIGLSKLTAGGSLVLAFLVVLILAAPAVLL